MSVKVNQLRVGNTDLISNLLDLILLSKGSTPDKADVSTILD